MQRLWTISRLCEAFPGALPSAIARELDEDPEQMALKIVELRAYAAAKDAFDRAATSKDFVEALRPWEGSPLMALVQAHAFEFRRTGPS